MSRIPFLLSLVLIPQLALARTRSIDTPSPLRDVTLSREIAVSDIAYGPGLGYNEGSPHIAVAPNQELVVWNGKAARLDANGIAIDTIPIQLPIKATAVAWNGSRYVAFGHDLDRIDSVEITTDGVIGPVTRGIANAGEINVYGVDVAITQHDTILAFSLLDRDGKRSIRVVSLTNGILLNVPGNDVRLIRGDGDLVLAASSAGSVLFDGTHMTPLGVAATNAAWTGHDFIAVNTPDKRVVGFHVSRDGAVGPQITIHTSTDGASSPAVACDGDSCRVVWKERRIVSVNFLIVDAAYDLYAATLVNDVPGDAVKLESDDDHPTRYAGLVDVPAIVMQNGSTILAWSRSIVTGTFELRDFYASKLTTTIQPQHISLRARGQYSDALTTSPSGVRVWWQESIFPNFQQRSTHVDREGNRAYDVAADVPFFPMTSNGREAFTQRPDYSIAVLDATTGALLRTFTLPVPIDAIRCTLDDCVAYDSSNDGDTLLHFTTSGTLIGDPVKLIPGLHVVGVAARGHDYLLAFYDQGSGLRVGRFFSDNRISDLTPVPSGGSLIAFTANDDVWFLATQDLHAHTFIIDDSGVKRGTDLTMLEPKFAWDGKNWMLAWIQDGDVYAARLSADASTLLDPNGFAVAATSYDEGLGDIKSIGNGRAAISYSRIATERQYGTAQRVFVRWIENDR